MMSELNEGVIEIDGPNIDPPRVSCTIEKRDAQKMSYSDFFCNYLQRNFPVILTNIGNEWPCFKEWVTPEGTPNFDYLSQFKAMVPVAQCNKKKYNAQEKNDMCFKDFLDYWKHYDPIKDECLYLKDWHFFRDFPDKTVYRVPKFFANDWLGEHYDAHPELKDDYRFVYMGPKGSWTPLHVDVFCSYSWSINITGRKRWVLLEPGMEKEFTDSLGNLVYDYDFHPPESTTKVHYVEQTCGETIFVPTGWHHQVWNLEDTISINHNWINSSNVAQMWNDLKINLQKVKVELGELSSEDNLVQKVLKAHYGLDLIEFSEFIKKREAARQECLNKTISLPVYGRWFLGSSILTFDNQKIRALTDQIALAS